MKQVNRKVLEVMTKIVRYDVEQRRSSWPPLCGGIFHQPKRPIAQQKNKQRKRQNARSQINLSAA